MTTCVGMKFSADGKDDFHVQHRILLAAITFGQFRATLRSSRLNKSAKISLYKSSVLTKATFGCEIVSLTSVNKRRYSYFNAKCCAEITGRAYAAEKREPSFDILSWIQWRRTIWLGGALRGEKGGNVSTLLHWNFQHRCNGDVFSHLPAHMTTCFLVLRRHAANVAAWSKYCSDLKPESWVWYEKDGTKTRPRRSKRQQAKQARLNERQLQRQELRRQLYAQTEFLPPSKVKEGELHIYTDGSAIRKNDNWYAGSGVWFARSSPHNISAMLRGKQTVNRAELTALVLAVRKAAAWPDDTIDHVIIHSDSLLCVNGINLWITTWKLNDWTRNGKPVKNIDLWKMLDRAVKTLQSKLKVTIVHVPAHVGVYGNERADALARAAARRAVAARTLTAEQQQDQQIENDADDIVNAILAQL